MSTNGNNPAVLGMRWMMTHAIGWGKTAATRKSVGDLNQSANANGKTQGPEHRQYPQIAVDEDELPAQLLPRCRPVKPVRQR